MNRTIAAVSLLLCTCFFVSTSYGVQPVSGMPSTIDRSAKYMFFFHNYYIEAKGTDGDCKYYDILKSFKDKGFIVISEIRSKDAPVAEYVNRALANIHKLLDAGVPEENITVSGHSKGGVIAIRVASLLEKPRVNYVILAGCGLKPLEKLYPEFSRIKGNFLSLYASSDTLAGSCGAVFSQAGKGISSKEIRLESTAGHQLFFRPTDLWFDPMMSWLNRK